MIVRRASSQHGSLHSTSSSRRRHSAIRADRVELRPAIPRTGPRRDRARVARSAALAKRMSRCAWRAMSDGSEGANAGDATADAEAAATARARVPPVDFTPYERPLFDLLRAVRVAGGSRARAVDVRQAALRRGVRLAVHRRVRRHEHARHHHAHHHAGGDAEERRVIPGVVAVTGGLVLRVAVLDLATNREDLLGLLDGAARVLVEEAGDDLRLVLGPAWTLMIRRFEISFMLFSVLGSIAACSSLTCPSRS